MLVQAEDFGLRKGLTLLPRKSLGPTGWLPLSFPVALFLAT